MSSGDQIRVPLDTIHVLRTMRIVVLATCTLCAASPSIALPTQDASIPYEIGNRAHGFSYQPTQSEVRPREAAAGLRPSSVRKKATDQTLQQLDRDLLRHEGLQPRTVPSFGLHE
jgi:hypothetical protein